ncbi:PTS system, galactitol-specific IIC component [Enterococcus sp. DIV2402]|jgi:PTS system galactitol-specific IIC component|uniref:PTS system, galactitol-specific IIC component n=1 Tax=Candidatus Enterococcus lowellii TaxID=2230877 RepID=A0ABZ2SNX0_9ENTE|nr:PTS transporter subunit IIC [Enterococcus sp. DIV2402]MBO0463759.1 PTS galactitol transporter subunit IIC [Enterococcus sp. DIV2402]
MLEIIKGAVNYVLDLGAAAMLPLILTIFGLILGQSISKSFRAGLTVGIGFTGLNLVIGLLSDSIGTASQAMIERLGLSLDILDVGWPIAAAITFATPIAVILIPIIFIFNIILLSLNQTKTMDVDLWNYWHLIFPGAMVYYATDSIVIAIVATLVNAYVVFKLADWTAPAVEKFFGLPGISLPHGETVNFAPITYALNKIWDKIPGINKININAGTLKDKLGLFGEPMMIGLVLGLGMGFLAGYDSKEIIQLGIQMSAVMILMPRMVALLMEGLSPIADAAKSFIQKRFPGKKVYIGLDAAVVTAHPAIITVALLMVPITILLAAILPFNRLLPFADLAVLPFTVIWSVAASKGNIFRGLLNAIVSLCIVFFIATNLGALTTTLAHAVGFAFPEGATMISGIDMSSHITLWIMLKLIDPSNVPAFAAGVIALLLYGGLWFWTRNDIKKQFETKE